MHCTNIWVLIQFVSKEKQAGRVGSVRYVCANSYSPITSWLLIVHKVHFIEERNSPNDIVSVRLWGYSHHSAKSSCFTILYMWYLYQVNFSNFLMGCATFRGWDISRDNLTRGQNLRDHLFLFSPKSKSFSQTALLWRKSKVTYWSYQ